MKTVRNVVASAILAALVFVLLRFVAIPTPFPDTTLSIYAAVVAFFAVLFGPAAWTDPDSDPSASGASSAHSSIPIFAASARRSVSS